MQRIHPPVLAVSLVACSAFASLAGCASGAPAASPTAAVPADMSSPQGAGIAEIFGQQKADGLKIEDIHVGVGPSLQTGDIARLHYRGTLVSNGDEFDSSRRRGEAFEVTVGKGMVIRGFERGMVGMRVGGVRKVTIPWQLAYGERGSPPEIPPRANLMFELELLDIPVPEVKVPRRPPTGRRGPAAAMTEGGGAPPQR